MEFIFNIFAALFEKYIDVKLAVLIVTGAYFFRKFLCELFLPKVMMRYKVLIWTTIISVVYYFTLQKTGVVDKTPPVVYIITYFFATSFYELIFQPLEEWIKNKTGGKDKDDTPIVPATDTTVKE